MAHDTRLTLERWGISPDASALLEAQHGDLLHVVVAEIEPVAAAHRSAVDAALIGWLCREVEAGRGSQISLESIFAQREAQQARVPEEPKPGSKPSGTLWAVVGAVVVVTAVAVLAYLARGEDSVDTGRATSSTTSSVTNAADSAPTAQTTTTASPTTTAALATTAAPAVKDGTEWANQLRGAIPSITNVVTLTEDNDPNNKLGRPNGYVSGAVIYDSGVECDDLGVDCGATIEVWPTAAEAKARSDYIQGLQKDAPMLGSEYNYFNGAALLRVSGEIKPSVAATYQAAFGNG